MTHKIQELWRTWCILSTLGWNPLEPSTLSNWQRTSCLIKKIMFWLRENNLPIKMKMFILLNVSSICYGFVCHLLSSAFFCRYDVCWISLVWCCSFASPGSWVRLESVSQASSSSSLHWSPYSRHFPCQQSAPTEKYEEVSHCRQTCIACSNSSRLSCR